MGVVVGVCALVFSLLKIDGGVVLFGVSVVFFILVVFVEKRGVREDATAQKGVGREFETLMETVQEGVVVYDQQFRIIGFNSAAESIFGLTANEVTGKIIEPALARDKKYKRLVEIIFPSLASSVVQISGASEWPQIVRVVTEEPASRFLTALGRATDETGRVICFFKSVKDETREQEILQSKTEFINTAAHQLRTPLTAINWALENIKSVVGANSPEITETINDALNTSERALKITNDLLDVAKIEEGRFGYELEDSGLFSFIDDVLGTLTNTAEQYGVSLSFVRPAFPEINIRIDKNKLGLALYNLIDNAIKYNTKGGKVEVWVEKTNNGFIRVNVRDSGVGIPEDEQKKIFKKFYRASNASEVQPNGNGLGLFITRNIIKRHGGNIGFESQIDRGTTFWFTLPLSTSLIPEKESVFEDSYN